MWDALRLDVRHAFRSLRRAPTFSLIVVVTLVLAVGATMAVGSLLNAIVLRRLGGTTGVDDDFAARSFENLGAWIMGRNMFGPVRGPWPDQEWKGWWGINPPYHVPVFVLTHHPRPPLEMEGGAVFHFVTEGIEAALDQARARRTGKTCGSAAAPPPSASISGHA